MKAIWMLVPAVIATTACQREKAISVSDGWVRLSAVRDRPSAAYFTLHGGPKDTVLLSVTSPVVIRTEMHESMNMDGMMTMAPLSRVPLPADGTVEFKPGGRHVMLYLVNPGVKPGWTMDLRYTFADGTILVQRARVVGPGQPKPE